MRRIAGLCLASGLFIMILALGIAISATVVTPTHAQTSPPASTNVCLYCHADVHPDWEIVAPPVQVYWATIVPETVLEHASTPEDQVCSNCHTGIDAPDSVLTEMIEPTIEAMQTRVARLRSQLAEVRESHPTWDTMAARADKTTAQLNAERVEALVSFIEADGSWGFHDPEYIETILVEAETLMADLLATEIAAATSKVNP